MRNDPGLERMENISTFGGVLLGLFVSGWRGDMIFDSSNLVSLIITAAVLLVLLLIGGVRYLDYMSRKFDDAGGDDDVLI